MTVNEETADIEEEEPEEAVARVADPWSVVQESRQAVNPFAKREEKEASMETAVVPPVAAREPSFSSVAPSATLSTSSATTSSATTIPTSSTTTIPTSSTITSSSTTTTSPDLSNASSVKRPTAPEAEQTDEITVAVVTGEPDAKKQKVEEEIVRLRRMSEDYAESERKRSVELLKAGPTNGDGQQDSDGFAFSEDDDDFDVPDIRIYSVCFQMRAKTALLLTFWQRISICRVHRTDF